MRIHTNFLVAMQRLTSTLVTSGCLPDTVGDDSLELDEIKISGLSPIADVLVNGQQATVSQDSSTLQQIVGSFTHVITQPLNVTFTL